VHHVGRVILRFPDDKLIVVENRAIHGPRIDPAKAAAVEKLEQPPLVAPRSSPPPV
jgi:hypothetical protein